jgi:hypothetical protein
MASRVSPRLRLVGAALAVATAGVAGCSARRLLYEMAPTFIGSIVDGVLRLDGSQRDLLRREIVTLQAQHRREELPLYATRTAELRERLRDGLQPDDLRWARGVGQDLFARLVRLAAAPTGRLLATLEPAQLDRLDRRIAEERRKLADETRRSVDEQVRRATDREVGQLKQWLGPLSREQRALVATHERRVRDDQVARRELWLGRQTEFVAWLRRGPHRADELATAAVALVRAERDASDAAALAVVTRLDAANDELFLELARSLSAAQLRKLDGELASLERDFVELSKSE